MYSRNTRSRNRNSKSNRSNRSSRRSRSKSNSNDRSRRSDDRSERGGNDFRMMSSMNDRVMDDRSMNVTKYRKSLDVDRIMLERQMTMDGTTERYGQFRRDDFDDDGRPSRSRRKDNYIDGNVSDGETEYGEVTGHKLADESERFDHGMPVRSSFQSRRSDFDQNSHLDFDLYDRDMKPSSKQERLYNQDDGDGMYSELAEAMNPITEGTDPYETCITGVNTSSCWLNDNMASIMSKSYGVSGYAMFSIMGVMYLLSDGDIQSDYLSYFEFQNKRKLNAGLLTIRDKLNRFRDQIVVDNYIISSYRYELNKKTASNLKKLAFVVVTNPNQARSEAKRVNQMVKKISGLSKVFSERTISSIDAISLVSVTKIRPIFQYAINAIVEEPFYTRLSPNGRLQPIRCEFLRFVGITCGFFEDRTLRLLEVPLKGGEHVFGLVMRKDNKDDYGVKMMIDDDGDQTGSIADIKKLSTSINYLEHRVLDEVLIPLIDQRFKLRLNKTLQKTGLKHIFRDPNYYRLYQDGANISDCIQYMQLTISDYSVGEKSKNKGYITACKYIADTEFEFYIRDTQTNTIFGMGRYSG
jgi:serine protease inhibitor